MGWSANPACDANTAWTAVPFLQQFVDAINERARACGYLLLDWTVVEGWIVGSAREYDPVWDTRRADEYAISYLQTWLEGIVASGVWVIAPAGQANSDDAFQAASGEIAVYTERTWKDAFLGVGKNWSRRYPRIIGSEWDAGQAGQRAWNTADGKLYDYTGGAPPWTLSADQESDSDILVAEGRICEDDYITSLLWNELQAGLNLLLWTRAGVSWNVRYGESNVGSGSGHLYPTWADAKTEARASWSASFDQYNSDDPQAIYNADCDDNAGVTVYSGFAERVSKRAYDSFGAVPLARRALFYVKAKTYSPGWYGQEGEWGKQGGDAILEPDPATGAPRWSRWDAQDVAANATGSESIQLGSLAAPDADLETTQAPAPLDARARGWTTDAAWIIYRWNVPGGFSFLALK